MSDRDVRRKVDAVFGLAPQLPAPADGGLHRFTVKWSGLAAPFAAPPRRPFSVFDDEDAAKAAELAGDLAEAARAGAVSGALERATALAASVARDDPGLARHALGLFSTHDSFGRPLPMPTLLRRTATLALADEPAAAELGDRSTGEEARLDWFRADPLANEHHEHWHLVYPFDRRLDMSLDELVAANPNMALSPVSIVHAGPG